jgi:hypothetical protein
MPSASRTAAGDRSRVRVERVDHLKRDRGRMPVELALGRLRLVELVAIALISKRCS